MIIHDVAQNSDAWYKIRLGKPTASAASRIITTKGKLSTAIEGYAQELAMEIYKSGLDEQFQGNFYTNRGHELEPEAALRYEFIHDVDTVKVGFVTDDEETIGASPDRLVGETGILEIKCLKDTNHTDIIMKSQDPEFFPSDRIAQTQMQFLAMPKREWNSLFFYHPELPPVDIRSAPNLDMIDALKAGITKLITRRDEIVQTLRQY